MVMNLWLGDYLKLRNDIYYLEFKLMDKYITEEEREEAQAKLDDRLLREEQFKFILNSFEDLDSEILKMKYIDGMTLNKIAEFLGYNTNYIRQRHVNIIKRIKEIEVSRDNLEQFRKNRSKKRAMMK